ncbi:MAG: polysaccharide biosynthesis protein [Actinomycetia bacterium]|nr:polysaccharide biosynthesis protein [Actinomycetes bacterium]
MQTFSAVVNASDRWRHASLHVVDAAAWLVTLAAATTTRRFIAGAPIEWPRLMALVAVASLVTIGLMRLPAFHAARSRRGSLDDAQIVLTVWMIVAPVVLVVNYFILGRPVPISAALLGMPLALVVMLGSRVTWRVVYDRLRRPNARPGTKRVIVFGAGDGGDQIIRAILRDPNSEFIPVAVLDDHKARRAILGVPALGTRADLLSVAARERADLLLIAIPSADSKLIAELDEIGRAAGLEVRVLPSTSELLGMLQVTDIRELTEADILGRAEVVVDLEMIGEFVWGRRVLVTGAGGSIGSELSRQLRELSPASLFMLDRDESALHALQLSMEGRALLDNPNLLVADIRDEERMNELFAVHQFDIVFHTAALKHLTLLEQHPSEGIKTNVSGSANLLDAAMRHGVSEFVNISTDKAADPTSVLGATKLLAERLTSIAAKESGLRYLSVRFGNVLGSRGSVLPTFREQIAKGGPVTVTDPDVTRFFMTIPEAVRLVLQAGAIGRAGEIMILDMGEPVRIFDVAKRLIEQSGKNVEIRFTGLRKGEKMHEVLVANAEIGATREHDRITHTAGSTMLTVTDEIALAEPGHSLVVQCAARLNECLEFSQLGNVS